MKSKETTKSLWRDSMRSSLPELDEERKNAMDLLELLEVRPLCSIASEDFISRFALVQAATEKFISHEEKVLLGYPLSAEAKRLHLADHEKIRAILRRIGSDAAKKKNQTALDVYKSLRGAIEKHVATFGVEVAAHAPARPTTAVEASV